MNQDNSKRIAPIRGVRGYSKVGEGIEKSKKGGGGLEGGDWVRFKKEGQRGAGELKQVAVWRRVGKGSNLFPFFSMSKPGSFLCCLSFFSRLSNPPLS
jgi:hypothetical protein